MALNFISAVTDEVIVEVTAWQPRSLERCYPVVIVEGMRAKMRDEGTVQNKIVYVVLGITTSGTKDVLGLCVEQAEGVRFLHRIMTELRSRAVEDVLIPLIDGLPGGDRGASSRRRRSHRRDALVAQQFGFRLLQESHPEGSQAGRRQAA